MKFQYNDGGREAAGFKGTTGDCVCRAIAIAAERPYKEVYDLINEYAKKERVSKYKKSKARDGVRRTTAKKILEQYGFVWVPTMQIGSGCKVHLREEELPQGRLVCSLSKHFTAVINGVINDTYDPNDRGYTVDGYGNEIIPTDRCVYGYYIKADLVPKDNRKYRVVYDFLAPSGRWVPDYLTNNDRGFSAEDADGIVEDFKHRDNITHVRKVVMR